MFSHNNYFLKLNKNTACIYKADKKKVSLVKKLLFFHTERVSSESTGKTISALSHKLQRAGDHKKRDLKSKKIKSKIYLKIDLTLYLHEKEKFSPNTLYKIR